MSDGGSAVFLFCFGSGAEAPSPFNGLRLASGLVVEVWKPIGTIHRRQYWIRCWR